MVANTGTYLDTPAHRYRDGHDLAGLPLERCALLPAVVVDGGVRIGPEAFVGVDVGRAPRPPRAPPQPPSTPVSAEIGGARK